MYFFQAQKRDRYFLQHATSCLIKLNLSIPHMAHLKSQICLLPWSLSTTPSTLLKDGLMPLFSFLGGGIHSLQHILKY